MFYIWWTHIGESLDLENDTVYKILSCLVILERKTAQFLNTLATLFPEPYNILFSYIANESSNHAYVLKSLIPYGKYFEEVSQCEIMGKGWNYSWSILDKCIKELSKNPDSDKAIECLEKHVPTENEIGEEYYTKYVIELLPYVLENKGYPKECVEVYEGIFREISQEEEYHALLLRMALEIIKKRR